MHISGSVANLSLSGLEDNYYHFLVELSARIHMMQAKRITPDHFIISKSKTFQKDFSSLLGIPPEKVLTLQQDTVIQADQLIVTSLINNYEVIKFRGFTHYQKKHLPLWTDNIYQKVRAKKRGTKKVYISRKLAKYRKILNEDRLVEILEAKGFESVHLETYSIREQITLFQQSSVIVAPHGAGLVNMSFSAPGTKIFELFPQYYHDHSYILHAYQLKHHYNYMIGTSPFSPEIPAQEEDIHIDLDLFKEALKKLSL